MTFPESKPRYVANLPKDDPADRWHAVFCSGCGELLQDSVEHACDSSVGTFCTQCGQEKHDYVCLPDARKTNG